MLYLNDLHFVLKYFKFKYELIKTDFYFDLKNVKKNVLKNILTLIRHLHLISYTKRIWGYNIKNGYKQKKP